MISGGTVTVGNAASFGGNLTFAGSGGVLEFETDTMPTAVISGLVPGDFLLFDNATFGPGATVTLTSGSPDVLSATLDGTHYTLHLNSSVSYAGFAFDAIPTTNVHLLAAFPMATAIEVVSVSSVGAGSSTSGGSLGLGQAQRVLGATLSLTVGNGGEQGVNHGGTANNTFVDVGGVQLVSSGGIAISAAVDGIQFIFAGGSAANAAITELARKSSARRPVRPSAARSTWGQGQRDHDRNIRLSVCHFRWHGRRHHRCLGAAGAVGGHRDEHDNHQ